VHCAGSKASRVDGAGGNVGKRGCLLGPVECENASVVPDTIAKGLEVIQRFFAERSPAIAFAPDPRTARHSDLIFHPTVSNGSSHATATVVTARRDISNSGGIRTLRCASRIDPKSAKNRDANQ